MTYPSHYTKRDKAPGSIPGGSIIMVNCKSVYEPGEDSTMLEAYVRQHAKGNVLDMGTGSGIQAIAAAQSEKVNSVLAVDIQKSVIGYCKKCIKNKKIRFMVSDLFNKIPNKKFDTIIFNPPYLPSELKVRDLTIESGKKGYEAIESFLSKVSRFLNPDGAILIVFSSLTKKEKVDEFIKNSLLEFELLEKQHYFFEDLYAYRIFKPELLKKLESKKIDDIRYFAKGKRGIIFSGEYKNKKIAVKIKNQKSEATGRIENEAKFLRILNKKGIGPKILLSGEDFLAYEFVEGINIFQFLGALNNKPTDKKAIIKIIKKAMEQLYEMDKLKISKEEMSHPNRHIIIDKKSNPVLIDFERTHHTIKPSNITQFCDFLISRYTATILKNNNITINKNKMINAAKKYKKQQNKENFNRIINKIK